MLSQGHLKILPGKEKVLRQTAPSKTPEPPLRLLCYDAAPCGNDWKTLADNRGDLKTKIEYYVSEEYTQSVLIANEGKRITGSLRKLIWPPLHRNAAKAQFCYDVKAS
jgi:hypothetical protein